jgi:hypothetical protein
MLHLPLVLKLTIVFLILRFLLEYDLIKTLSGAQFHKRFKTHPKSLKAGCCLTSKYMKGSGMQTFSTIPCYPRINCLSGQRVCEGLRSLIFTTTVVLKQTTATSWGEKTVQNRQCLRMNRLSRSLAHDETRKPW